MINPNDFKILSEKILAAEDITTEEAHFLLQAVYEMDSHLLILQNTIELSVMNAQQVIPALAELVLRMSGRTDTKIKKKVAQTAAEITAKYEASIHLYLAGAYEEAQTMIEKLTNGEMENETISKDTD